MKIILDKDNKSQNPAIDNTCMLSKIDVKPLDSNIRKLCEDVPLRNQLAKLERDWALMKCLNESTTTKAIGILNL